MESQFVNGFGRAVFNGDRDFPPQVLVFSTAEGPAEPNLHLLPALSHSSTA
jgi:hypothetical protein